MLFVYNFRLMNLLKFYEMFMNTLMNTQQLSEYLQVITSLIVRILRN